MLPPSLDVAQRDPGAFPVLHVVSRLEAQKAKRKPRDRLKALAKGDEYEDSVDDGEHDTPRRQSQATGPDKSNAIVYDVKFYPYTDSDEDAVFAVAAADEVYVYRPSSDPLKPLELLCVFKDPSDDASLNSLVWSQDLDTGDPLLCFGGAGSGAIKIVNVVQQSFVRTLSGHGGAIQDLAVSPLTPTILASACADFSIRLWNLDPQLSAQPCAAILASPDAHKQSVLAITFHSKGAYLLSGGTDTMINLWPVPTIPSGTAKRRDKVAKIFFPLFSSTEVHADYVDCLRFHGDLILSHSANTADESNKRGKDSILLWKIDGFNSADVPPEAAPVAEPGVYTRSAFGRGFQRLLTFDMPETTPFYMRFSLFDRAGFHPVLVMGNDRSRFSFWDLHSLETGQRQGRSYTAPAAGVAAAMGFRGKRRGRAGYRGVGIVRRAGGLARANSSSMLSVNDSDEAEEPAASHDSDADRPLTANGHDPGQAAATSSSVLAQSEASGSRDVSEMAAEGNGSHLWGSTISHGTTSAPSTPVATRGRGRGGRPRKRGGPGGRGGAGGAPRLGMLDSREGPLDVRDPFFPLPPHHTATVPKYNFTVRQVAWSNCGRWCVGVGEAGLVCVFKRWV